MHVPRKALIAGIDVYDNASELDACVADAEAMAATLKRHKDGAPNYECRVLAGVMEDGSPITRASLLKACEDLFQDFSGDALLYFSGHGVLTSFGGFLCTTDAADRDWGVPVQTLLDLACESPAREVVFIIDCCHGGAIANPKILNPKNAPNPLSLIREGMTVIASSRDVQSAVEAGGHGLFTAAVLDALEGGAADHMGWVSAPSVYSYVRRRFGAWNRQSPVYKSNTTDVAIIRQCEPLIDRFKLQRIVEFFPTDVFRFPLDPEYEPEDENGNVKEPINHKKVEIARLFKDYRDAGLLKPTSLQEQLYWTARRSNTVELTARGREYWWLVKNDKI